MNTDTDGTKGDEEGPNSRKECDRRAENGREQTETDGDRRRQTENVREQNLRNTLVYPLPSVLSGVLSNRWSRGHGEVEEV